MLALFAHIDKGDLAAIGEPVPHARDIEDMVSAHHRRPCDSRDPPMHRFIVSERARMARLL